MIAGMDKYFQIVRCFRDEDLRADRQPEFTQVDIEMSFAQPESVFRLVEPLIAEIFAVKGTNIETPFPRVPYREVMDRFGSDKPDMRFGLEFVDLSPLFEETDFPPFRSARVSGQVKGIAVPGCSAIPEAAGRPDGGGAILVQARWLTSRCPITRFNLPCRKTWVKRNAVRWLERPERIRGTYY
jgi:aspartyl-tRNA synthetase